MSGMTPEQLKRIESDIENLKQSIEVTAGGKVWKLLNVLSTLVLTMLTVVIIPFGVWTVNSIHALQLEDGRVKQWMDQGPRFTASDAKTLRLETKQEIADMLDKRLLELKVAVDQVSVQTAANHDTAMQTQMEISQLKVSLDRHLATDIKKR